MSLSEISLVLIPSVIGGRGCLNFNHTLDTYHRKLVEITVTSEVITSNAIYIYGRC